MRILHFADVHIGVENYGKIDPESGLSTRLIDFLKTFDEVVDYAIENNVDLALFCGDAYKSRDPNQTHQREFAKRVARLTNAGIPVFLVIGNHDTPHVIGRATSLEIFQTLDVPNVYIGDTLKTYSVETRGGPLQVVAVPWIRRSGFLTRDETRGMNPSEINEAIQERLSRAIRAEAEALNPEVPAVLAGHVTVGGSETSSEQSMMLGRDPVLLKSDVALPQFDYVALGHIHKHQILGEHPHVVYSGSLQRIDFGEEKDKKGFAVFELDPVSPPGLRFQSHEYIPVDARRFVTISVDIADGDADPNNTVLEAIAQQSVLNAVVRLRISIPGALEGLLKEADIKNALDEAHFVASVSKEVKEQSRTRLGATYTKSLDPKEALGAYLESRAIAQDRAKVLMERADALIDEQASQ